MPMPTRTTVISCGVPTSSLNPSAYAASTTIPLAAVATRKIATSGTTAASGPRKNTRLRSTTAPNSSNCASAWVPSLAFTSSATLATPPVKPTARPWARACAAARSRTWRN